MSEKQSREGKRLKSLLELQARGNYRNWKDSIDRQNRTHRPLMVYLVQRRWARNPARKWETDPRRILSLELAKKSATRRKSLRPQYNYRVVRASDKKVVWSQRPLRITF